MAMIFVVLVVALLIALVVVGAGGGAAGAARLAAAHPGDHAHAVLVGRFIDRSVRYRRNGGLAGLVVLVAVVIVRAAAVDDGQAGVRFDLLTLASIALAGSIVGSIAAEGFRLRARTGPRVATLDVRSAQDYSDPISDRRELVVAALAAIGIIGSVVVGESQVRAVLLGLSLAALAVIRRWAIRRIALRPRPPLPDDVRRADDELRRLAASVGVSRPIVTLGALLLAAQWGAVSTAAARGQTGNLESLIAVIAWIGSVGAFLVAVRWWWQNRSFGLADRASFLGIGRAVAIGAAVLLAAILVVLFGRGF